MCFVACLLAVMARFAPGLLVKDPVRLVAVRVVGGRPASGRARNNSSRRTGRTGGSAGGRSGQNAARRSNPTGQATTRPIEHTGHASIAFLERTGHVPNLRPPVEVVRKQRAKKHAEQVPPPGSRLHPGGHLAHELLQLREEVGHGPCRDGEHQLIQAGRRVGSDIRCLLLGRPG